MYNVLPGDQYQEINYRLVVKYGQIPFYESIRNRWSEFHTGKEKDSHNNVVVTGLITWIILHKLEDENLDTVPRYLEGFLFDPDTICDPFDIEHRRVRLPLEWYQILNKSSMLGHLCTWFFIQK